MKKFVCILFFAVSCAYLFGGAAELISAASKNTGKVAVFMKQSKTIELFGETVSGDVLVCADANGRIRWQTFSPYESIMICDGKELSQYEKFPEGWKKLSSAAREHVKKITAGISKMMLGDYSEYEVAERDGKIWLTPKDSLSKKAIKNIALTPAGDGATVKSIELSDTNGDRTLLTVVKIVKNPKNFESAFTDVFNFKVEEE